MRVDVAEGRRGSERNGRGGGSRGGRGGGSYEGEITFIPFFGGRGCLLTSDFAIFLFRKDLHVSSAAAVKAVRCTTFVWH